jgi:hypothetical protein
MCVMFITWLQCLNREKNAQCQLNEIEQAGPLRMRLQDERPTSKGDGSSAAHSSKEGRVDGAEFGAAISTLTSKLHAWTVVRVSAMTVQESVQCRY